jgi:hypothetical protein
MRSASNSKNRTKYKTFIIWLNLFNFFLSSSFKKLKYFSSFFHWNFKISIFFKLIIKLYFFDIERIIDFNFQIKYAKIFIFFFKLWNQILSNIYIWIFFLLIKLFELDNYYFSMRKYFMDFNYEYFKHLYKYEKYCLIFWY